MQNLTEKDREDVKKEAKEILDKFAKALEKVEKESEESKEESSTNSGMREEGSGSEPNPTFREIMFDNAPKKSKDFILAEKGEWK